LFDIQYTRAIYAGVIGLGVAKRCWQIYWVHRLGAIVLLMFFDVKARKEEIGLMEKFPDYRDSANLREAIDFSSLAIVIRQ
jgi:protein-S-isoprenylcysteine O-methyltransferase Ste14